MSIRPQETIDAIILTSKQNAFNRMMVFGANLQVGVAEVPALKKHLVLIWCTESNFSTLAQRNVFVDFLAGDNLTVAPTSSLGANNLLTATL